MTRKPVGSLWRHAALWFVCLVFLIPAWGMFATSMKTESQIARVEELPWMLWPRPFNPENYRLVFELIPFGRYFANTLYVTLLSVLGTAFSCTCAAYAFSRLRWPGRNVLFGVLLTTMMLPPQVTLVPQFIVFSKLGWANTYLPLWVPTFFGTAFFIFLLRQFFMTIPKELEEAAEIDGCGHIRVFWRILIPLLKPAILAVVIFQFLASWNDFVGPLVYLNRADMLTMSVGLQAFKTLHGAQWGLLMAAATIMAAPVLFLFFCAQKYFIEGVTITGLK